MWVPFRVALLALWTLAVMAATGAASAQTWPARPVTVVVPFAAGSSTDTAARILTVGMSEVLGQQLVIENVDGAAGMTGTLRVARAARDGYQLLFGTVDTLAIAPALQKQPPYDTIKDFAPASIEPVSADRRSAAYQRDLMVTEMKAWADQVKASGLPFQ